MQCAVGMQRPFIRAGQKFTVQKEARAQLREGALGRRNVWSQCSEKGMCLQQISWQNSCRENWEEPKKGLGCASGRF